MSEEPKSIDEWKQFCTNITNSYKTSMEQNQLTIHGLEQRLNTTESDLRKYKSKSDIHVASMDLVKAVQSLTANVKGGRLKAPVPVFHGKENVDVVQWLFLMENMLKVECVDDKEKVLTSSGYLRELALETYRAWLNASSFLSWSDFRVNMLNQFWPHNFQKLLRNQLDGLSQTGSFAQYLTKFNSIMNRIANIQEDDKIHYFIRGLARKTRQEVGYRDPKTLLEAIQIASTFENHFFGNRSAGEAVDVDVPMEVNFAKQQKFDYKSSRRFNEQKHNNIQSGSYKKSNYKHDDKKQMLSIKCFRCGKYGHMIKDCRS